jgi:hypothetical protein
MIQKKSNELMLVMLAAGFFSIPTDLKKAGQTEFEQVG